jgi:hypothetical protein
MSMIRRVMVFSPPRFANRIPFLVAELRYLLPARLRLLRPAKAYFQALAALIGGPAISR